MLSIAARTVWGKSWPFNTPVPELWNPLWRHLRDTQLIAGRLWDEWLPAPVRETLAAQAGGEPAARVLLTFLAGAHDSGKATPVFCMQVGPLRDRIAGVGLQAPRDSSSIDRRLLPHGLAGQVLMTDWLVRTHAWPQETALGLSSVVGGHHGIPPSSPEVENAMALLHSADRRRQHADLIGGSEWRTVQDELLADMAVRTGADGFLSIPAWHSLPQTALSLLMSVVVVADWLASNSDLFPLTPYRDDAQLPQPDDSPEADAHRLDEAWRRVRLPAPWAPEVSREDTRTLLHTRFGIPEDAPARPVQGAAVDIARTMDPHGMLIVEAPMGEGKTEAAMLAAEILAGRSGAAGVMVALPTQATSDAMFARLIRWVEKLPHGDPSGLDPVGESLVPDRTSNELPGSEADHRRAVFLAHGKAWLNPDFARVPRGSSPTGDLDRDGGTPNGATGAYVDGWMVGRRKGILADFVVGTIDQVLFTALQARHVELRHLAFARKVVVLDEVHAADEYMLVYLERALEWLGALGTPVIALSATLPPRTRERLISAHRRGASAAVTAPAPRRSRAERRALARSGTAAAVTATADASPRGVLTDGASPKSGHTTPSTVLTFVADDEVRQRVPALSSRSRTIHLEYGPDDDGELAELVAAQITAGGCVLIVRNTVARAQRTFRVLQEKLADTDLRLLHSRFLASDRKERESHLVDALGAPGRSGARQRPHRLVVVATQVVEQSLDVDFDLLVTDLAPIDLLLQRIGRLHRHDRAPGDRPSALSAARTIVVGMSDKGDEPPVFPPDGVEAIYGRHLLLRTAAQVQRIVFGSGTVRVPEDIAPLVKEAYGTEQLGPDDWQGALNEALRAAEQRRQRTEGQARTFCLPAPRTDRLGLTGWLDASVGEADVEGRAQVRDSGDSFEVIVVERDGENGPWLLPRWWTDERSALAGQLIPMNSVPDYRVIRALAGSTVSLPAAVTIGKNGTDLIESLEQLMPPAWQQDRQLAGQLVLPIDSRIGYVLPNGASLRYHPELGLTYERNTERTS